MLSALQKHITWRAIPIAALAAGTVYLLINIMLMPLVLEVDPLLLIRYQASLVMGPDVLVTPGVGVIAVGLVVHYALAFLFSLIIAIVVHRWGLIVGVVGGGILGLAFYGIDLYTMTLVFPWFFAINNPVLLLSHILFGATAGGVYELLDFYDLPLKGEPSDVPS